MYTRCIQNACRMRCRMQAECVHNALRMHTGCAHAKRRRNAAVLHTACMHECVQVAPRAYEAKCILIVHPGFSDSRAFCYWSVWVRAECIGNVHGMYAESVQNAHAINLNCTQMHTECMHNAYEMYTDCMQNACAMWTECVHNTCRLHTGCMQSRRKQNADAMHTACIHECAQVAPRAYEAKSIPIVYPVVFRFLYVLPLERLGACRMRTECAGNVCRKRTECTRSKCKLHANANACRMHTIEHAYTNAYKLPHRLRGQKYPNYAPWVFRFLCALPLEPLGACRMHMECTRNACRKHTECTRNKCKLHENAHRMHV